jgi:hypothetical protein
MVFLPVETLPCGRTCAVLLATISNPFLVTHLRHYITAINLLPTLSR